MREDPWSNRDPEPGSFDADLASIDPDLIDVQEGHPDARLRILVSVEGEEAARLGRLANERGQTPSDVIAGLLRDSDASPA